MFLRHVFGERHYFVAVDVYQFSAAKALKMVITVLLTASAELIAGEAVPVDEKPVQSALAGHLFEPAVHGGKTDAHAVSVKMFIYFRRSDVPFDVVLEIFFDSVFLFCVVRHKSPPSG